jgi:dTDP-4-dehydrorhamnose 3,5-epimerase
MTVPRDESGSVGRSFDPAREPNQNKDLAEIRDRARRLRGLTAQGRQARDFASFRADWGLTEAPVVQVNLTTTFPGRIRAWGIHCLTVDRLFAATGSFCIVCYDGRRGSPTFGCVNEFMLGERNQGLVVIPPGVYHGWKNIGADEATIVSMPSELYNHDGPDRWELPWDSDAARRMIPYQWP